jgi:hypothetical protein
MSMPTQDQLDALGVPVSSKHTCPCCGATKEQGVCVDYADYRLGGPQENVDRLIELARDACAPAVADLRQEESPDA